MVPLPPLLFLPFFNISQRGQVFIPSSFGAQVLHWGAISSSWFQSLSVIPLRLPFWFKYFFYAFSPLFSFAIYVASFKILQIKKCHVDLIIKCFD
jgi:hypothetical protein